MMLSIMAHPNASGIINKPMCNCIDENNNVIKPNKDFETQKETNQIKKVKSNNADSIKEDGDSQMSLF